MGYKQTILVTGGAGYIGSHVVALLKENGYLSLLKVVSIGFLNALSFSIYS